MMYAMAMLLKDGSMFVITGGYDETLGICASTKHEFHPTDPRYGDYIECLNEDSRARATALFNDANTSREP